MHTGTPTYSWSGTILMVSKKRNTKSTPYQNIYFIIVSFQLVPQLCAGCSFMFQYKKNALMHKATSMKKWSDLNPHQTLWDELEL